MEYKVLKHFQLGQLKLEKEQTIIIEKETNKNAVVSLKHYPDKKQNINIKAIDAMIALQKIEMMLVLKML